LKHVMHLANYLPWILGKEQSICCQNAETTCFRIVIIKTTIQ